MLLDLETTETLPVAPDIVILGAGAVGILLAVSLARRGMSVLLCESGGKTVESAAQALNHAVVAGRPHAGIAEGRARVLGGTTTLWGGQLTKFQQIDFAARPWLGLPSWPIGLDDIAPYYDAVADMLGLPAGGKDQAGVWHALGLTLPHLGAELEMVLTRWLKEPNFSRIFAKDIAESSALTVLLHANATAFVPENDQQGDGQHIAKVRLAAPGGRILEVAAERFIVATGTIEASRLMLAAAHADATLAWADNPLVGAAFQDHLDLRAGEVTILDRQRFGDAFDNIFLGGFKYNPKVTMTADAQAAARVTNIASTFTFESSVTEHLANVKIFVRGLRNGARPPNWRSMPSHLAGIARIWWPLVRRYVRDHRIFNPADLGIGLRVHCEQLPLPESRIRLDPAQRDRYGVPLAVLDWRVDGRELDAIATFTQKIASALEAAGLARVALDPRVIARDSTLLDQAQDTNHHCGGLQMGRSAADGVVDADLRVFGTTNLFVAGAATFRSSSFANPTYTALALALRLGDHLAKPGR